MAERHCAVVRIVLLDQHVAVETSHLVDREYADAAEGSGRDGKHFTFRHICSELGVSSGLQAVESDLAGSDIAFERSVCNFLGKRAGHDHLVLHLAGSELAGACVAAVEAHEGILVRVRELALDRLLVHILRDRVVDV